jgi:lipid-binding SYLF domain-containing protein
MNTRLKGSFRITAAVAIAVSACLALPFFGSSSDRQDDVSRIDRSAAVFQEITATPDHGIPNSLLQRAKCIGIIPGQKKLALGFGGQYGKGLVTCRNGSQWSAPLFITIGGGSWGLQIGGSSTDVVMVFLNRNGVTSLLSNKFRVGAGASAAAGPVGRSAAAQTDAALHAEILTYSRSRGAFAGVSLNGSVVQPDDSGNTAMYGAGVNPQAILDGQVPPPAASQKLAAVLTAALINNAAPSSQPAGQTGTSNAPASTPPASQVQPGMNSPGSTSATQENSPSATNPTPETSNPNASPNPANANPNTAANPNNASGSPAAAPATQAPTATPPSTPNGTPPPSSQNESNETPPANGSSSASTPPSIG